ncbi:MAG: hypothetical protein UEC12_04640, partial [Lachnospiraceae bacterium]|nr:hypothetical protein [Lachnospiraceae bacterium]
VLSNVLGMPADISISFERRFLFPVLWAPGEKSPGSQQAAWTFTDFWALWEKFHICAPRPEALRILFPGTKKRRKTIGNPMFLVSIPAGLQGFEP